MSSVRMFSWPALMGGDRAGVVYSTNTTGIDKAFTWRCVLWSWVCPYPSWKHQRHLTWHRVKVGTNSTYARDAMIPRNPASCRGSSGKNAGMMAGALCTLLSLGAWLRAGH